MLADLSEITTALVSVTGLQRIQTELVITGAGTRSNCHAHDRKGGQGRHVGGAAELSLGNIMDANTGESL